MKGRERRKGRKERKERRKEGRKERRKWERKKEKEKRKNIKIKVNVTFKNTQRRENSLGGDRSRTTWNTLVLNCIDTLK